MQHQEIISGLMEILSLHEDFNKFESSVPRSGEMKKKLGFDIYIQELIRFNKSSGGDFEVRLQNVLAQFGSAMPDFNLNSRLSKEMMIAYSKSTGGKSHRMEQQLLLSKLLEIKALFKDEADVFKPKKITSIKKVLKDLK